GRSQRQGDAPEALESVGSQVPCRLQKAQVQLLQSGVEGQNHKGQEYVTQTQDHGKLRVQQLQGLLDNAQLDQAGVNQAAVAENKLQCVGAHQRVGPERNNHQKQYRRAPARGQVHYAHGKRIADQQANQCGQQ